MTDFSRYRVYDASECGGDGYPISWNRSVDGFPPIKDEVRADAGDRCQRCRHPYRVGQHGNGEWSRCDELCRHGGPARFFRVSGWPSAPEMPDSDALQMLVLTRPVEARWRILTVHHLDGDKANCRPFNLCCLCQRCHLSVQSRVRMSQVYPHEHSEWFKPYAAAYYAQVYLGETLTLEDARGRLDELLALERVVV